MFEKFEGYDRFDFPQGIVRVTAGYGGESFLITGSEKTALYDCGMAYCGDRLVMNIEARLGGRDLDYILLSHTHYDHVGALPYVRRRWPNAVVYAAEHGKRVLERPGALKVIGSLGATAAKEYTNGKMESVLTEGLAVHISLKDGDELSLGDKRILALETKGHTDCSMTYIIQPGSIMITSESTGVLERKGMLHTAILKSYDDAMASLKKCREYDPKIIISPHFGVVPPFYNREYWRLFEQTAREEKEYVDGLWKENLSMEEMLEKYKERFWKEERRKAQPLEAFLINAKWTILAYEPK
ncbi:MAG: MBL fold metallo-hydrolase [Anaerovoracaceae bacterium]|jgi:glyoxylase-like metal-dependent hydrolase (beta-lactamase superfamily II)